MNDERRKHGRLRRAIDRIANRKDHYLGRLWHWAAKRGVYTNNHRWKALASWAHMHRQYAFKKSHRARKHDRPHQVVHRLWLRGHHWVQIELAYRKEKRRLKKHKKNHQLPGNLVTFDGHLVAGWIVRESLLPARNSGLWQGVVFSGFRTPEYSEHLCYLMCGAPTCPGQCAGRNTNHACPPSTKCVEYEGAVDVSDSTGLSNWESRNSFPTRHTLPSDLPHHSRTGQ